ncbi:protein localization to photoreceptor outer segment [Pristimantis euphronides]
MGCSPSHNGIIQILAKNAAKPLKRNKALLPPDHETNGITVPLVDNTIEEIEQKDGLQKGDRQTPQLEKRVSDALVGLSQNGSFSDDQGKYEKLGSADEGMVNLTYQKRRTIRKHSSTGSEQEMSGTGQPDGNSRRNRKSKSQRLGKHSRRAKTNQAGVLDVEKKVDFPEELVKAHQDAYAFLNPNLSKYEAVISMANQAAQTHIIMQQMISFMALRFEDINQCLDEIAEDGEKLLKAIGSNLTWPFGKGDPAEQPDLLQQLLQYTVNKMQSLNGTVSSLTTNALQDSCSLMQSAVNKFQERLKEKEHCDERLVKMIKSLEDLAAGSTPHHPNDTTLYSEDSGIGGDSESMRGSRSPDKMGRKLSMDSSSQVSVITCEVVRMLEMSPNSISAPKENTNQSSGARKSNSGISNQNCMSSSPSMSSLGTTATLGEDSPESEESTSSDESSDESEDNKSLASQVTLTQRPLTSPAGMGPYKHPSKWLENLENEEMTLKMKEAISEKIKFVPGKSISNVWTREEEVNTDLVRPSTADGSNRRTSRQRRSRSAESLRSQSEDPTLFELQRTQKELSKKLEQLYSSTKNTDTLQNPNIKSFSHTGCIISSNNSSTNKLKACLAKSFNILPSQDRVSIRKIDMHIAKDSNSKSATNSLQAPLNPKDEKKEEKFLVAERNSNSINASPRQSVRKLIQTFSPVDDTTKKPTTVKTLGPLRCVRKFGVPVLPPTIPAYNGLQCLDKTGEYTSTDPTVCATTSTPTTDIYISSKPYDAAGADMIEYKTEDFEDLPPPPPEILMDDSFTLLSANEQEKYTSFTCTMQAPLSQKMKTSINIKNVLPSKNITDIHMFKDRGCRKDDLVNHGLRKHSLQPDQLSKSKEVCMDLQNKNEIEQAANLYKQSHKIIHLQNPGDGEMVSTDKDNNEPCSGASMVKPKQYSPTLQRNVVFRKLSPTRAAASSPPTDRKLTSPPTIRTIQKANFPMQHHSSVSQKTSSIMSAPRASSPPNEKILVSPPSQRKLPSPPSQRKLSSPPQFGRQQSPSSQRSLPSPPQIRRQQSPPSQHRQPSPPQTRRQQSPPSQHRQPSPPQIRKQQSPPSQRKLPSPPQIRNQQSPPSHRRLPSPPQTRHEPSPPSFSTPSPPVSPSHTGLRRHSEDQQLSSKIIGNAQSIFCPSSSSLFEAKSPSPPGTSRPETVFSQVQSPVLRHTSSIRDHEQHRRVAMSAANPQPFVRRSYSERRPRVQLRFPTSISANAVSDLALQQTRMEEFAQKDSEPATSQGLTDPRAAGQTAEKSALCVVGQGLQKE